MYDNDDAFALLCLQAEWGADDAIGPDPVSRWRLADPHLADPHRADPQPAALRRPTRPLAAVVPPARGAPGERALAAANAASTLEELRAAIAAFDGCALRETASNLVFAEGNPTATTLLIGEPPGREEDRGGHPFAGIEGRLLDQMLASIQVRRSDLLLTHLLPWRPPGGRPVNPAELALCLPFLHRLVVMAMPRRALLLGPTVIRALLPPGTYRRRSARGWVAITVPGRPDPLPALALPSIADLLKSPGLKRDAWTGLRLLRHALENDLT